MTAFLLPIALIAASVLCGVVIRVVVVRLLIRAAKQHDLRYASAAISAVKNMIIFWSFLLGLAAGLETMAETVAWRRQADLGLFIVFVLTAALATSRLLTGAMRAHAEESNDAMWTTSIARRLVQLIVLSIAVLLTLSALGMQITAVLTVFGIGGAAFALSLQDTLGNVFAGASISLGKQIRVGDYIMIGTTIEGVLCDIGWRNSTITLNDNTSMIVPNRDVANGHIRRFTGNGDSMILQVVLQVDARTTPQQVISTTTEVLTSVASTGSVLLSTSLGDVQLLPTPPPYIRLHRAQESVNIYVVTVNVNSLVRQAESRDALTLLLFTSLHGRLPVHAILPTLS